MGRMVEIVALASEGDTPIRVFFPGDKVFYFHGFARSTYLEGDAIVTVNGGATGTGGTNGLAHTVSAGPASVSEILRLVANYAIRRQERAISPRHVQRQEIFAPRSPGTGFTVYYRYKVHGATVWTFRYDNPSQLPRVLDRSRLRLSLGNLDFIPDYTSISQTSIGPGEHAMGVALFWAAPFDLKQADKEGVWRWKPRAKP
jgi:hypothetical protein